ncbi:hypothetical protein LTR37_007435 [Vermiconidia calcicola]|uniref:Uncharacterized protein n=1 Tax=Vermiconidia calcicola TaxID=1690605 RepID=A0ACC3NE32_9PEZI|nr:hypothetical protein LTR37_007435 [Vermiconidia calcicola]
MEEDDDDFYGGQASAPDAQHQDFEQGDGTDVKMEAGDEQQEEDDDSSDEDVQFTLEKPEGETPAPSKTKQQKTTAHDRTASSEVKARRTSTPVKQEQRAGSTQPTAVKGTLTHDGKEGKDFPGVRISKVDVNGTPIWPANGKPITEVDIDADLAEHSKPWRLPGTDQTDFFNYGFDEYTWAQYCLRQQTMSNNISDQKQADAQMKAMFGGAGGPGGGGGGQGGPPGMPSMPGMGGMPSPEEMMQQMMSAGLNPGDQNQFMQFMMSGGMPPGGGPGQQNQQQGGGFAQQGGGGGGGFGGSASPHPQGQGFQPPQGPSSHNQQGDQGGFNTEGYSPQQLAIMQQQQQGGGGGRGRGRGRGRGYY